MLYHGETREKMSLGVKETEKGFFHILNSHSENISNEKRYPEQDSYNACDMPHVRRKKESNSPSQPSKEGAFVQARKKLKRKGEINENYR